MNKTVTINISGLIFNIDEEAYSKLRKYLATIEGYFKNSEGGNEIMTDIEGRIAEMFSERISDRKEVVSMTDVDNMIATMGQPEDFIDEETKEENARNTENKYTEPEASSQSESYEKGEEQEGYDRGQRRFFRDPDGRIVGGVCSGIGYYFGIDPVVIRLLFVIAVLLGFSGVFVYIIFWIITPKASTRAEKLQMKGRKVNIDNIRQTVKDEANEVKKNFKNFEGKVDGFANGEGGRRVSNFFQSFFSFIGSILRNILNFLGRFLGLILILFGGFFLFTLTLSLVGIAVSDSTFMFDSGSFSLSVAEMNNLIFNNDWASYFFSIGLGLFLGIPLVLLLIIGFKIVLGAKGSSRSLGWVLGISWFIGIVLLVIGIASLARDFTKEERSTRTLALPSTYADTVSVSVNTDLFTTGNSMQSSSGFFSLMKIDDKAMFFRNVKLNITESENDSIIVSIVQKSRAGSFKEALAKAENIGYSYAISGDQITFDPYFSIPLTDQYRFQEVFLNIAIPIGKTVYLSEESSWIIYDIKNRHNTHDGQMTDKYWTMTENGLECLHCNFLSTQSSRINYDRDLNSLTLRELNDKLYDITNRLEIKRLDFEKKLNRKRLTFEKQIIRLESRIENSSNETKLKEYKMKLEETQSNMKIELKKAQLEFDRQLRDFEVMMDELEDLIEEQSPKEDKKKTSNWEDSESDASTSSVFTRLSFPSPFRILS